MVKGVTHKSLILNTLIHLTTHKSISKLLYSSIGNSKTKMDREAAEEKITQRLNSIGGGLSRDRGVMSHYTQL